MGSNKSWSPSRIYAWAIAFLLYINDLTKITNNKDNNIKSKLILFANNASPIVTSPNSIDFIKDIITTIKNINVWFKTNILSLKPNKTNFMHFITKNSSCIDGNLGYDDKLISNTSVLKFLWLITLVKTQNAETKYGLRIQFLALVFMIHEMWLNA